MRHSWIVFILFLLLGPVLSNNILAQNTTSIPLTEALDRLENTFGVRFSYVRNELDQLG